MKTLFLTLLLFYIPVPDTSSAEQPAIEATKATTPWLHLKGKASPGKGKHIVFVTGEEYYRSEESMPMFARILSQRHGFDCTVLFAIDPQTGIINPNQQHHIPGLEQLATADLLVLFIRFRELPDESMKAVADYINAGKPVLAIRNATHPFRFSQDSSSPYVDWDYRSKKWPGGFGQQILGDTWVSHYGKFHKEATLARMNPQVANHPVLRGVAPELFARTDVNEVNKLTAKDTILFNAMVLSGPKRSDPPVTDGRNQTLMPWAWFHEYHSPTGAKGRSFCITAGASVDWLEEDLRRLVVNAVYSLSGLEDRIPPRNNVEFVNKYQPSHFGSKSDEEWIKANLHPTDFGLSKVINHSK